MEGLTPDEFVEKHLAGGEREPVKEGLSAGPSFGQMSSSAEEHSPASSSEDISPDEGFESTKINPDSPV